MDKVSPAVLTQRDPLAVSVQYPLNIDRLFYCLASFFVAVVLLSISTRMAHQWQWLALLLLTATGLVCSLLIVRRRDVLTLRTSTVIAVALLLRLPAMFAAPLLDDDHFRFLWDGQQLDSGLSPYLSAPSQHFLRTDLSAAWSAVLSDINHPDVPTIYGPSLQVVFALAALLGQSDPWALRLIFLCIDLALVITLLRAGCAPWMVLLYLVNPMAVKEIGFSLHPDGIIALFMSLALLALGRLQPFIAGVCAAVVICAKLPLLLMAATLNLKNAVHRKAIFFCALATLVAYLPFLFPDPMQPFVGLRAFADLWRFNALGFLPFEWVAGSQARLVLTAFYVVAALVTSYRMTYKNAPTATATITFLALILFTAPTVNPWYWLPLLPLALIAERQDGTLLLTPWLGSFALLLGYANGATLADLGINSTRGEFSVLPFATVIQWLMMTAGFAYDLRRSLRDAALFVALRIPLPLSNALIRRRFPSVTQMSAHRALHAAATDQPMLWLDVSSAYCPLDLSAHAQAVNSKAEALKLAAAFQQQHPHASVALSCAVGYRSSDFAAQLTQAGVENVVNIEGGRRALGRWLSREQR